MKHDAKIIIFQIIHICAYFLAVPSSVQNDRVVSVTARSITLAWDKPIDPNVEVMHYEVRKYPRHFPENVTTVLTSKLNYTFKDLELKTEYIFRVSSFDAISTSIYLVLKLVTRVCFMYFRIEDSCASVYTSRLVPNAPG